MVYRWFREVFNKYFSLEEKWGGGGGYGLPRNSLIEDKKKRITKHFPVLSRSTNVVGGRDIFYTSHTHGAK